MQVPQLPSKYPCIEADLITTRTRPSYKETRAASPSDPVQVQRLPGWFKQRDNYFYPAWAYVFPTTVLRMPYSLLIALLWSLVIYYPVGLAPQASRCAGHKAALSIHL